MKDSTTLALVIVAVVAVTACGWIIPSCMEARAYNRLTDGNATTWDAMFVQLRVQGTE